MNREEAIKQLEVYRACMMVDGAETDAYDIAIEALEQQPCEDAISRQEAIDAMYHHFCDKSREECAQILHEVPSVTPQANNEDIHREREQAYMRGYEDASGKYRTEPCEDAISRQAAIDIVRCDVLSAAIIYGRTEEGMSARKAIVNGLKRLPSVSTEKTRWIPVSERLPEVGIDVLMCDMEGTMYLSHRSSSGNYFDEWGSKIKDIRAWMPLPEPYVPDTNDGKMGESEE